MKLSIIIISYNTKNITKDCIHSVIKHTKNVKYELILLDNASKDGSVEMLKNIKKNNKNVKLILNKKNIGFGPANNKGVKNSSGEFILFLNSDTLIKGNVIGEMVNWMQKNKNVAVSSCMLRNKDNTIQGNGGYFPDLIRVFSWMFFIEDIPFFGNLIKPFHPMHDHSFISKNEKYFEKKKELDWVTGAYMIVRSDVIKKAGLFDEDYFMYTEEVDLCFRIKKLGYSVYYLPKWDIIHYGGASSTKEFMIVNEFRGVKTFYKKNYAPWKYIVLTFLLRSGCLLRAVLFGIIKGKEAYQSYVKAYKTI